MLNRRPSRAYRPADIQCDLPNNGEKPLAGESATRPGIEAMIATHALRRRCRAARLSRSPIELR